MPKKLRELSPDEQKKLFEKEVQKRIAAGELNPESADEALDWLVKRSRNAPNG